MEQFMETIQKTPAEQIERGEPTIDAGIGSGGSPTIEAESLHDSLGEMADGFDVTGFKCVKCGLVHMHDTMKHRLSDTFDIGENDAATQFDYNSVCHCGVQEAAQSGDEHGIDQSRASDIADDAPVPPGTL